MLYLTQVSNYRVRTREDMVKFIDLVIDSTAEERGEALDTNTLLGAETLKEDARTAVGNRTLAAIFGELRDGARDSGAPKTSAAVITAASWFYNNVEKPQTSSVSTYTTSPDLPDKTPFYKKSWFLPVAIGVVGVALAGAILLWPEDEDWQIQD